MIWWLLFSISAILLIPYRIYIFILLSLIIIWVVIWYVKSKIYIIQKSRILSYYWIIYKNKISILNKKIDFIEKNQWFIHKIFWNWNVSIFTKSSWSSDMKFIDISEHNKIYDLLKDKIS